jgi:hypothetical protein
MGRRHTAGAVGNQGVGGVQVDNTTLTAADDLDITIDPSGTGRFVVAGDLQLQAQGDLRFADSDSSNYVAFQGASTISSNVTWTLPAADGSANQALVTNASGTLSFATVTATITDNNSDSGTNYITFTTTTSGALSAARVATTTRALTYQPSTGALTATTGSFSGLSSSGTISFSGAVGITATTTARQINPEASNTYDLGTTGLRWRNIYTQDLHLSNGIGDYTVVEGEENLYLVNNKTNKSFKFALIEVDPAEVPLKSETI